jgi:general secretion pathway protein G
MNVLHSSVAELALSSSGERVGREGCPAVKHLTSPSPSLSPEGERENGFSLVEVMVVLVIIALLTTVVALNVLPAQDKAMVGKAKADIAMIDQGLEMYKLNNLAFPQAGEGLQALVTKGVIKKLPNDPWGRPYRYLVPGQHGEVDVYTLGADGVEGGEDDNADIGNWQ